jgi:hypothetical protein
MDQNFFNRILHLLNERPKEGKRMIGLGATALGELWQRISELEQAEQQQRNNSPDRKRQAGGGRKKEAEVLCRLLVTLLYLRQHWTMQSLAEAMGCAESTVWNYIHEMLGDFRELNYQIQEC